VSPDAAVRFDAGQRLLMISLSEAARIEIRD
jgi:hypothetical protein